jgi:hypothetical protein
MLFVPGNWNKIQRSKSVAVRLIMITTLALFPYSICFFEEYVENLDLHEDECLHLFPWCTICAQQPPLPILLLETYVNIFIFGKALVF